MNTPLDDLNFVIKYNGDELEQCYADCVPIESIRWAVTEIERLRKAAIAYQNLSVCYRLGKRPTEKLFTELEVAKQTLSEGGDDE